MKSGYAKRERGAALVLFAAILVVGVAWFTVSALGKASPSTAQREIKTGQAAQAAKRALLGYIAQYAARTDHDVPGRLPCPELLNSIGTGNEGQAPGACSNTVIEVGRLPWRTLGADRLVDGYGEPFWYVLSPGFRQSPINFDTLGQLTLDGALNAAVALIIAPGPPLQTQFDPDVEPAGCTKRNQVGNRFATPLNPLDFLECGHGDTVTNNYVTSGSTKWLNDRVLVVTAAEVMDALGGPVADRIQRQVAPALETWRSSTSLADWGTSFLPFASTIAAGTLTSTPATNDLCGNSNIEEGMPPTASASVAACSTSWSSGSVTQLPLPLGLFTFLNCSQLGSELRCRFTSLALPLTARVTATAPRVSRGFRAATRATDITITNSSDIPIVGATITNLSSSISSVSPYNATLTFDVSVPLGTLGQVRVHIPNLPDAAMLSSPAVSWFIANGWDRHTYYAVARFVTMNPGAIECTAAIFTGCLTVNNLPASNGNTNDKHLVLVLMGRPVTGQSRSCTQDLNGNLIMDCVDLAQHMEGENATSGNNRFVMPTVSSSTNDRIAACPFRQTSATGTVSMCP